MNQLQRVAIHEAAHAVIARVFDVSFRSVTIVPREGFLGACNFFAYDFYCDREGRILASMAGRAAELEFFGSTAGNYRVDDELIAAKLHGWPKIGGVEASKLHEPSLRQRALRLVEVHRDKIERVAEALLERQTLTADEVDKLLA